MSSMTRKRLYQVVIGYDILVAIDEFDSLTDLVNQNVEKITSALTSETMSGVYQEIEVESEDDIHTDDLKVIPYTNDGDQRTVAEYIKQIKIDQLEPCPFCGSTDVNMNQVPPDLWQASCSSCGATGPRKSSPEDASDHWRM